MSEGELKKLHFSKRDSDEPITVTWEEICKKLDEAKKEYLAFDGGNGWEDTEKFLDKWFKKWFGDGK